MFSRWKDPEHDTGLQTSRTHFKKMYLIRQLDILPLFQRKKKEKEKEKKEEIAGKEEKTYLFFS